MPSLNNLLTGAVNTLSIAPLYAPLMTQTPMDRILAEAARLEIDESTMAARLGVTPQTFYNWKVRGLPGSRADDVASKLRWTIDYLLRGVEPASRTAEIGTLLKAKLNKSQVEPNVIDGPPLRGRVPLISWTTAGMWADVEDTHPPGNGDEWIMTTANVGPHAFALRVQGDSMEPRVPDGSIVIIDPDRGHHHGSIVLAKRTSDQQATLKQLWYDGATPKLRPLNERYDILDMPPDTRIIGVAVKLELDL